MSQMLFSRSQTDAPRVEVDVPKKHEFAVGIE
jgi:hypothetical protein